MDLAGQYSNQFCPAVKLLSLLAEGSDHPPRVREPETPRRPENQRLGAIKRAVLSVLSEAAGPVRALDVHASVEKRLGRRASYDNIRKVLAAAAGDPSTGIARAQRGRYTGRTR